MQERERTETTRPGTNPQGPYLRKKTKFKELPSRKAELFARIKRTSKYYFQGLDDNGKQITFPVESIQQGLYTFRLNHNNYQLQDLTFYVKDGEGRFLKLN